MGREFEIREIEDGDLAQAVVLLCEGFPRRTPAYWQLGLRRLATRERPPGSEKYGYALADGKDLHGLVLTIPSMHERADGSFIQVNMSSWCARPEARGKPAKDLFARACEKEGICYTDLSAAPHTVKTITALGFRQRSAGQMLAVGVVPRRPSAARCGRVLSLAEAERVGLASGACELLADHERLNCLALCVETDSHLAPMVFVKRRIKGFFPSAQLIYCEDLADLVDHGRQVWPWLARRGFPNILLDCSSHIGGLVGRYVPGKSPKYLKGACPTKAVDHTYSEMALLGF